MITNNSMQNAQISQPHPVPGHRSSPADQPMRCLEREPVLADRLLRAMTCLRENETRAAVSC